MSTGLIIAIVVVALIIIALLVMLPRMRAAADRKKAERELLSRRETVAILRTFPFSDMGIERLAR